MDTQYKKDHYKNKTPDEIKSSIKKQGFEPIPVHNSPSYEYPPHAHPETKLLAILDGSIEVAVSDKKYQLKKDDLLIVSGNTYHSAKVGKKGCRFFWSEKRT